MEIIYKYNNMKHADIFSGIGGWCMAANWAGWDTVFNCEINKFCRQVLKYHYPNAIQYEDITKTDFSIHRGGIDILTGSWPCQPFSVAGKQTGTNDERYLWGEAFRAIREIKPRWFVGENVPGFASWDGGMELEKVLNDLESEGYEAIPFIIPAAGVGAPHKRDRLWIVARNTSSATSPNTCSYGLQGIKLDRSSSKKRTIQNESRLPKRSVFFTWQKHTDESPIQSMDDGLSHSLHGITFSSWKKESIIAAGNSVVPQLCYQIFYSINEYERRIKEMDTSI